MKFKNYNFKINVAYNCYEYCAPLACSHGGYPNPNDCSRCVCPTGFGGKLCRQVQYSDCGGIVEVNKFLNIIIYFLT